MVGPRTSRRPARATRARQKPVHPVCRSGRGQPVVRLFGSVALGDRDVPVVDVYDSATDQWSTVPLLSGVRPWAAGIVGNTVIVAGGSPADVYDASTGSWS